MSGRLLESLTAHAAEAIERALGVTADPDVRETGDPRFGDYQINGVLPLAKTLRDNPRALAAKVLEALELDEMCEPPEIAGPGFINLRLRPQWVASQVGAAAVDPGRKVGVRPAGPGSRAPGPDSPLPSSLSPLLCACAASPLASRPHRSRSPDHSSLFSSFTSRV